MDQHYRLDVVTFPQTKRNTFFRELSCSFFSSWARERNRLCFCCPPYLSEPRIHHVALSLHRVTLMLCRTPHSTRSSCLGDLTCGKIVRADRWQSSACLVLLSPHSQSVSRFNSFVAVTPSFLSLSPFHALCHHRSLSFVTLENAGHIHYTMKCNEAIFFGKKLIDTSWRHMKRVMGKSTSVARDAFVIVIVDSGQNASIMPGFTGCRKKTFVSFLYWQLLQESLNVIYFLGRRPQ